ncbi:ribonuclease T2-like [Diadema antillarum]|uniref:ribonuclease T2-like n=1 Tax=Diadema antillarum TaxID=105358 RepID=UPI003A853EAB
MPVVGQARGGQVFLVESSLKTCTYPAGAEKIWTIHGLWPAKNGQKGPVSCDNSLTFANSDLASMNADLTKKWPSYTGSHADFWMHEYKRHGTCATDVAATNTAVKYFNKTLELYGQHDLKAILNTGKVAPSSVLYYPLADVTKALKDGLGVAPGVFCIDAGTYQRLWEIRLCYSKSELKLIDCGSNLPGKQCDSGKRLMYAPYPSSVSTSSFGANVDLALDLLVDIAEMVVEKEEEERLELAMEEAFLDAGDEDEEDFDLY